jgi:glycosyltransferase involved in cell wall biosynthesis
MGAAHSQTSVKSRPLRVLHWLFGSIPPKRLTPAGDRKKIAFIKRGPFSHTNTRVGEILEEHFPEYILEPIDIEQDILRPNKATVLINLLHVFRIYGWEIFRRRRTIRDCFYRTPYIFHRIKELVQDLLQFHRKDYVFSIQTQSLYDASVPGIPHFVYTDHSHLANLYYPAFDTSRLFSREWIDLEREVYRNSARIFIMSNHVGKSIVEHYGVDPNRLTTVFAGSNVELTQLPLANDNYQNQCIVFIGVDWERKGGPLLLSAFKRVQAKLPKAKLIVIGSSPKTDTPGVEIVGRVPLGEVEKHLVRASVFCMPTKVEPFGIAPIEALTHRIPVVASRIGALPDIVQHGKTGLLVAPDSVDELADALFTLLSNPQKCKLFGELGDQLVRETYTWHSVGERLRREIQAELNKEPAILTNAARQA